MKTILNVPFSAKERAKALGARYDMALKKWYVPDGVDLYPFLEWVPNAQALTKKVKSALRRGRM